MPPPPIWIWRKATPVLGGLLMLGGLLTCLLCGGPAARGGEPGVPLPAAATAASANAAAPAAADDDGAIPQPLKDEDFDALVTTSPFTRSLGISDSLILTGVAQFEQDVFATLLDTKTQQSHVVSRTANQQGWQLVGVGGDPERMQTWSARIQVPGGEVVSIRYQKPPKLTPKTSGSGGSSSSGGNGSNGKTPPLSNSQLAEAKKAAENYREGFSSDGYPRQPPPEMVAKLSRLSVSQREDINRQMIGYSNQGLGLPERRKIYEGLVERAGQGGR